MKLVNEAELVNPVLRTVFGELSCIGVRQDLEFVEFINLVMVRKTKNPGSESLIATKRYILNLRLNSWRVVPYKPYEQPTMLEGVGKTWRPRLTRLSTFPYSVAVLQAILDPKVDGKQFVQALISSDFNVLQDLNISKVTRNFIFGLGNEGCSIFQKFLQLEAKAHSQ